MQHETTLQRRSPVFDYNRAPVVAFWEITRACALKCRHCRAQAQPRRHPLELNTEECLKVVDQFAGFDPKPILIISGGDPLMRRDLFDVVSYGVFKGIQIALSPSVTALVTARNLAKAHEAGVRVISISLDGADAVVHDGFRGVAGSFDRTVEAIETAHQVGLGIQVNTTISKWNLSQIEQMGELIARLTPHTWTAFFLVPTGRARSNEMLSPQEHEQVFNWLYDYSRRVNFRVRTTLGQQFRRVQVQRSTADGLPAPYVADTNDGKGVLFISHLGGIYPSGFLPLICGDVRRDNIVDVYQHNPLFVDLRDPARLKGKCGRCPFNTVCGGCRARAFAATRDPFESDPVCPYQPQAVEPVVAEV